MNKEICERQRMGISNNCALCENVNKEVYKRCKSRGE